MNYSKEQLLKMEPLKIYTMILNGEIDSFPKGYFSQKDIVTKEKCAKLVKHLFKKVLKWNDEEFAQKVSKFSFYDYNLTSMFTKVYNSSMWEVVDSVYPGKYKPWQFGVVANNYWNKERAKEAVKWVIEEKMKWTPEEVCKKISKEIFLQNNLEYPFNKLYNSNPYKALNEAYPGKYIQEKGKIIIAQELVL